MVKPITIRGLLALYLALFILAGAAPAQAQGGGPDDQLLAQVGVDQRLNAQVPLDLVFHDEAGKTVRLSDYLGAKPVILTLNYFECPNLCTLVLTRLTDSMRDLSFDLGKQFNVVTVSINPREKPDLAAAKKAVYVDRYGKPEAASGWHFLTGDAPSIERLTQAVGFRYFYDLAYAPRDLRLGLVEASANQIGSPVDQFLLRCYHYDPVSGRYTPAIMELVRVAFIATVLCIAGAVLMMLRRGRSRQLGS